MSEEDHRKVKNITDHLFRHEAGKMIAALTRLFGFHNAEVVEDVVQEVSPVIENMFLDHASD